MSEHKKTRWFAMDSALGEASVACDCVTGGYLQERHLDSGQAAEQLVPTAVGLAEEVGVSLRDAAGLVVTVGPGGFTGVRIALAAAQGMALAANCPVIGVTTLQAMAGAHWQQAEQVQPLLCLLDQARGQVAAQWVWPNGYEDGEVQLATEEALWEAVQTPQEAGFRPESITGIVIAQARLRSMAEQNPWGQAVQEIAPSAVGALAYVREKNLWAQAKAQAADVQPLYLRAPDAKLPTRSADITRS